MRSAISRTSGRRWLTYTTPTPRPLQAATVRCSASTSSGPRAVVGSSSSSTFGSVTSALATSKSWRSANVRKPAGASGNSSRSRSNSASSFARPLLPPPERRSPVLGRRQEEVVLHGFGQDQRGVLIGHGQAQLPGLRRGVPAQGFAPDPDGAQIGVDEPAGDPEEGRLPRPVLADDGVDLAGTAVEADVGQRPNRPELPRDTAHLEDEVPGGRPSSRIALDHQLANINCRHRVRHQRGARDGRRAHDPDRSRPPSPPASRVARRPQPGPRRPGATASLR